MGKKLIIAEKPSVASDIAKALGGFSQKTEGQSRWLERDDFVISSAFGHLLELGVPQEQDTMVLAQLPVIPSPFTLVPIEKSKSQLRLLGSLLKRPDVTGVINACDAGREGELIFQYIYVALGCKKPYERLWLQSMTPDSIKEGMRKMRSAQEMKPLFDAARSRSEADWLMGVNPTRALSKLHEQATGEWDTQSTGRVQGPTLALIVDREDAIRKFVPKGFWEVQASFAAAAGTYGGVWIDPNFVKGDNEDARPERLWDAARAEAIAAKCRGQVASSVVDESTPKKVAPHVLFDLTTLQREANVKFGFGAKQTLDLAQALYEKHKVLSYPRTDAKALPEDYIDPAKDVLRSLQAGQYGKFATEALDGNYVKPNKRVFDNSKISDHFAIIPTLTQPQGLSDEEAKIYGLVVRRFIAAFFPHAEFLKTVRISTVADERFKSTGSVTTVPGWMAVYGKDEDDADADMCRVAPGEKPTATDVKAVSKQTKAPDRYTEATLLAAMEHPGKLIDDEALREAISVRGLGTPATRAATIEGLLLSSSKKRPYVAREAKYLVPLQKAFNQVAFLRANGVAALTSAELTGEWEYKLKQMEAGQFPRADFMSEIVEQTKQIIDRIRSAAPAVAQHEQKALSCACPKCDGQVSAQPMAYGCSCGFRVSRVILERKISESEVEALIRDGRTAPLDGFVSKTSRKKFSAPLKLSEAKDKAEFDFSDRGEATGSAGGGGAAASAPIGKCPKCSSPVSQRGDHFFCGKNTRSAPECDFVIFGTVAKKKIDAKTVALLLDPGRTPLMNGFTSSRTGNKFSAYLIRKPDFTIGFEFES
ncbi:DNA topoisomerase 3 [Paraburkholderia domus]|uniref:DNA topoisomerase n=1 Tax=Paraburkholderia domus TaxID=2793075 RepID=UPI00191181F3|nr:DNA topoisomerase [Paraburkholderia domus]MBK5052911.1 topoisomerase C-terminal repeat-containing protein [Burkholderia sp. R-70006]CAE6822680.1 DNA topoisomerase 3 [Paraburkholderia domus]